MKRLGNRASGYANLMYDIRQCSVLTSSFHCVANVFIKHESTRTGKKGLMNYSMLKSILGEVRQLRT